ncbi:MAG: hypothetical protein M3Y17_01925 [Actinomycetota bacterium]|nr:hypothetical protein [Actinomycetota bacterium]
MKLRSKKLKSAVPFNTADLANLTIANPYVQRIIEDGDLRENVLTALDSTRSAYDRLTNGKASAKSLLEDKKLQSDLSDAIEAIRDAATSLSDVPTKGSKGVIPKLLVVGVIAGVGAVAANEKLRKKVLDKLFGSDEEFEYTPPSSAAPATPVGAA